MIKKNCARYLDEKNDPLSGHLFSMRGEAWKNMRVKVSSSKHSNEFDFLLISKVNVTDLPKDDDFNQEFDKLISDSLGLEYIKPIHFY